MSAETGPGPTPATRLWTSLNAASNGIDWAQHLAAPAADEMGDDLQALAAAVAQVQDVIREARLLEGVLTMLMGRQVRGKDDRLGELPDGRQWRLHRTAERKSWDHDRWKHDARQIVAAHVTEYVDVEGDLVVAETGEVMSLGRVLHLALTHLQEFHGAAAPRTGTLKRHDLDPGDYCEQVPGNWKLDAIAPSENHDQQED